MQKVSRSSLSDSLIGPPGLDGSKELAETEILQCCWNPEQDSLSVKEIVRLARRMSKVHWEMNLYPEVLIKTRINPDFDVEKRSHFQNKMRCTLFLVACAQAALPWIYANTLMPYPCKFQPFLEQKGNSTAMQERNLSREDCYLQDFIRSVRGGGIMGVTVVVLTLINMSIIAKLTSVFCLCYEKTHEEKWLKWKRLMWRPLLMLWYFKVSLYMPTLKYMNSANTFPFLNIPASFIACFTYIALVLEVLVFGIANHAIATACVAAYAMGELWLFFWGCLTPSAKRHVAMRLELECHDEESDDLLQKMMLEDHRKDRTTYTTVASVTIPELKQLKSLEVKAKSNSDFVTHRRSTEGTIDDIGVITHVLLMAHSGTYKIDLAKGLVHLAARRGRSFSTNMRRLEKQVKDYAKKADTYHDALERKVDTLEKANTLLSSRIAELEDWARRSQAVPVLDGSPTHISAASDGSARSRYWHSRISPLASQCSSPMLDSRVSTEWLKSAAAPAEP